MNISFKVPGDLVPKKAPNRTGGKTPHFFPNPRSAKYQSFVKLVADQTMAGRPLMEGPVRLIIGVFVERPKYHFGTGKTAGELKQQYAQAIPITRPDGDNIAKTVCDAMNGIVYQDDKQVFDVQIVKFYCDRPYMGVHVQEVDEPDSDYLELYNDLR